MIRGITESGIRLILANITMTLLVVGVFAAGIEAAVGRCGGTTLAEALLVWYLYLRWRRV